MTFIFKIPKLSLITNKKLKKNEITYLPLLGHDTPTAGQGRDPVGQKVTQCEPRRDRRWVSKPNVGHAMTQLWVTIKPIAMIL